MREQDIMYLSELIENRIISYCIKEEGSLQEHLNIGEELAHRAMIQALHNVRKSVLLRILPEMSHNTYWNVHKCLIELFMDVREFKDISEHIFKEVLLALM